MSASRNALVVLRSGPERAAVARLLRGLGASVEVASDPFEGTARFAEAPAALVLTSLAGWGRRDLRFLASLRGRGPATTLVVLVPDDRRRLAAAALAAGADAYLREPLDLAELEALARRVLAAKPGATGSEDPGGLPHLAAEVGHAVNNPLQVLSLLLEDGGGASTDAATTAWRKDLRREVDRIRDAVEIVVRYGRLGAPAREPVDLAALLAETTARLEAAGALRVVRGKRSPAGPAVDRAPGPAPALADPGAVRLGLDALLRALSARSTERPARVRVAASGDGREGEIRVRVRGMHLSKTDWADLSGAVLRVDETTRAPHPGLGIAAAVAEAHGGSLRHRDSPRGTVVRWCLGRTRVGPR